MLLIVLLSLVTILNIFLGLLVFYKNPRNPINISFAVFVLSIVTWMVTNFLSNQLFSYETSFLINKLVFITSSYLSYGLLMISIVFPNAPQKYSNFKTFLLLALPVIISNILVIANQTITGITYLPEGGTGVEFGWAVAFFAGQFVVYTIVSLGLFGFKPNPFKKRKTRASTVAIP